MLKDLIKLYIVPLLKREGFAKNGLTWNREMNGYIHVIDCQSTKPKGDGSESFTINVGILIVDLWKLFWPKDLPKFVQEENCYPRFRLGYLLSEFDPKRRDKWWSIKSQEDIASVGSELEAAIAEKCLPLFDGIRSPAEALALSETLDRRMPIEKISHAILLNLSGDKTTSLELLSELTSDPHWGGKALQILDRLNG